MQFTIYSDAYLKGLKKDELIALYRQLEDNLKSEIAEKEMTETCIRAANIKVTEQHKKDLIEAKKEAIEEFTDTFICKIDDLKLIKVNLGCDTIATTFRKEALLNLISDIKKEQCLKIDKLPTKADIFRSLLKRYN